MLSSLAFDSMLLALSRAFSTSWPSQLQEYLTCYGSKLLLQMEGSRMPSDSICAGSRAKSPAKQWQVKKRHVIGKEGNLTAGCSCDRMAQFEKQCNYTEHHSLERTHYPKWEVLGDLQMQTKWKTSYFHTQQIKEIMLFQTRYSCYYSVCVCWFNLFNLRKNP